MGQQTFDTKTFRAALGTFTTGVTIITTTAQDGTHVGLTANSFNSVSLDPPLILWSLAKNAYSVPTFTEATHWNVHVLSAEQEQLSSLFASRGKDKFAGLEFDQGISDAPLLQDCTARFQCRTAFIHDGGDHLIFIGEVLDFDQSDRTPLAFQGGQYALAARKPWEGVQLSRAEPSVGSAYTEDLLGYLLGRAHFQILARLKDKLGEHELGMNHFFTLSVLCIKDQLSLDEINGFIEYTGHKVTKEDMAHLMQKELIACDPSGLFLLTGEGREASVHQIALARAVEEELNDKIGAGDVMALKLLLKRIVSESDPGLPDLWAEAQS